MIVSSQMQRDAKPFDFKLRRKDGTEVWVDVKGTPLHNAPLANSLASLAHLRNQSDPLPTRLMLRRPALMRTVNRFRQMSRTPALTPTDRRVGPSDERVC